MKPDFTERELGWFLCIMTLTMMMMMKKNIMQQIYFHNVPSNNKMHTPK